MTVDPKKEFPDVPGLSRRTVAGDQDAGAPLGKGEMTILKDMESLEQEHDQYMEDLKGAGQSDSR